MGGCGDHSDLSVSPEAVGIDDDEIGGGDVWAESSALSATLDADLPSASSVEVLLSSSSALLN